MTEGVVDTAFQHQVVCRTNPASSDPCGSARHGRVIGLGVSRDDAPKQIAAHYRKEVAIDTRYRFDDIGDGDVGERFDNFEFGRVGGGQLGGRYGGLPA